MPSIYIVHNEADFLKAMSKIQMHEDTPKCQCKPRIQKECPECFTGYPGCWLCGGKGWIDVDPKDIEPDENYLIIHNA